MKTRRQKCGALVSALSVALSVVVFSAAPALACGRDDVALKTLAVSLSSAKNVYRVGDTAVLHARVTREVNYVDVSQPTEGAEVFVSAFIGEVIVAGGGVTDENGRATIRIKLRPYVPAGAATVSGSASIRHVDNECPGMSEESEVLTIERLFRTIQHRAR